MNISEVNYLLNLFERINFSHENIRIQGHEEFSDNFNILQ